MPGEALFLSVRFFPFRELPPYPAQDHWSRHIWLNAVRIQIYFGDGEGANVIEIPTEGFAEILDCLFAQGFFPHAPDAIEAKHPGSLMRLPTS